jgi:plasmid maintenance system antidote protein VapI
MGHSRESGNPGSEPSFIRLRLGSFPRKRESRLSSLLNGKSDLSGDMALRIEKAFGVKLDTLMRMQASYNMAQTRKRENQIRVRRVHQLADIHA